MNEKENQFKDLRRALKLKQHEIPPPGYFDNFSSNVMSRIRAGEARPETWMDRLQVQSPWIKSFLGLFETKPGIIGGFATSLCLLMFLGVMIAEHGDGDAVGQNFMAFAAPSENSSVSGMNSSPLLAADSGGLAVSTNPVVSLQPASSMFGGQNPLFQSVSFAPALR